MCAVCIRYLFRKQVIKFVGEKYKSSVIVLRCLTGSELHLHCEKKCQFCAQWICVTYHKKLKEGHIPNQSMANNLKLATQPTFLSELNPLEQHLVSRVIPFMKIVTLPKSLQKGVKGPVICVPANMKSVNHLPRTLSDSALIKLKLKRNLNFKSYHMFMTVSSSRIKKSLKYLVKHNPYYADVTLGE